MPLLRIPRNAPCPCGSGKKYKRCHGDEGGRDKPRLQAHVMCWAFDRLRRRTRVPHFERRLYGANSEQARFLIRMCAEGGSMALPFGREVLEGALVVLKAQPVQVLDIRGLVLGFHAKAVDLLVGARAVTRVGSLGSAMLAVRSLFETYVRQTYLLQADPEQRGKAYRKADVERATKAARERVLEVGPAGGDEMETLFDFVRAKDALGPPSSGGEWAAKSIAELAGKIGLESMYATLYRQASYVAHAGDADWYNPVIAWSMVQEPARLQQPWFATGYGLWSVGDALALASFLDVLPYCLFGNTADFFQLQLSEQTHEVLILLRQMLHEKDISALKDLRSSFPDIVV